MNQNPFDGLDEQLRGAVTARSRRGRRRVSRRTLVAVAGALTLTGGVAAAASLLSTDADQAAAQRAVNRGTSAAYSLPACAARRNPAAVVAVQGPPSAAVLAQLGVFRRPATATDRLPRGFARTPSSGSVFLKDTVRVARTEDGARFLLFITRGAGALGPADAVACATAAQAEALKAAARENGAVRSRVQAIMSKRLARARSIASGATESLNFLQFAANGRSVGGGATYITNGTIPALTNYGTGKLHGRRTVNISGLVPDGIATVRAIDRGGPTNSRVAPVTVAVHDNVYSIVASRRMGPRVTLDWRNGAGKVVRRVHISY